MHKNPNTDKWERIGTAEKVFRTPTGVVLASKSLTHTLCPTKSRGGPIDEFPMLKKNVPGSIRRYFLLILLLWCFYVQR